MKVLIPILFSVGFAALFMTLVPASSPFVPLVALGSVSWIGMLIGLRLTR